jgi:hypothetical protein
MILEKKASGGRKGENFFSNLYNVEYLEIDIDESFSVYGKCRKTLYR